MIQQALFPKSTKFRRPKRTLSKWGDKRREWHLADGTGKAVETRGVAGIVLPRQFKAIVVNEHGECLVSRHRKLKPALAAVVRSQTYEAKEGATMIELELELAFNMFGKLDRKIRRRLRAVAMNPCQDTWEDAHSIILGHGFTTLWQAVIAVDPTFARSKPLDDPWPMIPSQRVIVRAIEFATH